MAKIDNKVKDTSTKPSKKLWILPVAVGSVAAVLIGLFTWQLIKNNNRGGGGGTQSTCKLKFDSDNCKLLTKDNQEIKTIDLEAGKPYTFKIEQTDNKLFDAPNNISMSSPNDDYLYNYSNGEITLTINEDATLGAIAPYAATHFIGFGASSTSLQGNGFYHITFGDTEKYPFSIDWGDGDVIEYDPNDPDVDYYNVGVSHEYKQEGKYDITIYGAVNSIVPKGLGLRTACYSIIFGDKIKYIEDGSYAGCFYQDVYISDGVKVIGDGAFQNCQLKSVYLPSTLDYLGNDSFECANSLKEVRIAPNTNLSTLANNREYSRDKRLFYNVFAYNSSGGTQLESIYIGRNSIFDMQDNEFYTHFNLLKSITFEDDDCYMTRLPKYAFRNNYNLISFTCPKSVVYIDTETFFNEGLGLMTLKLSPNLKYIKERAFAGNSLSRIEFTSKKPPTIDPNTFSNLNNPFKIVVPKGCAQSYINTWRGMIDESYSKILLYIEEADL